MPGSISTKAPKLVRLRTLPLMRVPTGYLSGSTIHGSCSVCFMPSEIFSSSRIDLEHHRLDRLADADTIFDG